MIFFFFTEHSKNIFTKCTKKATEHHQNQGVAGRSSDQLALHRCCSHCSHRRQHLSVSTSEAPLLSAVPCSQGQSWRHTDRAMQWGQRKHSEAMLCKQLSFTPSSALPQLRVGLRALWHHQCKKLESNIQVLIFFTGLIISSTRG